MGIKRETARAGGTGSRAITICRKDEKMSLNAKHKTIPKKLRELIYRKYQGHCAYCGCKLEYKDMQVDHVIPKYREETENINTDNINNYMPACRLCNFYKSSMSLGDFKIRLSTTMMENLKKNFNYKLAVKYGLIQENIKPIAFYFEQFEQTDGIERCVKRKVKEL